MERGAVLRSLRDTAGTNPTHGRSQGALCVAIGDINLVRALAAGGLPCVSLSPGDDPSRSSRHVRTALQWVDPDADADGFVGRLLAFAGTQDVPPVVMPQSDAALLALSRQRDRLDGRVRHGLPPAELLETLVDKARFDAAAVGLGLPVPRTQVLPANEDAPVELRFPIVVKPFTRAPSWGRLGTDGSKAIGVADAAELGRLREAAGDLDLLAQELVPGPESRIESYHVYADASGDVVAEFTGRKIRTYPLRMGYSTAVEITDAPDVATAGRHVVASLELTGVAKVDFKRDADGRLRLLEVNPRFNLWHYPGALAGVNLPALVYADLTGTRRPPVGRARAGVTWCAPWADLRAAREGGEPLWRWLAWFARCDARSNLSVTDPWPVVAGRLWPGLRARLPSR